MQIFLELLILILLARAFGEAAERLGQPASLGEILSGVFLALVVAWVGTSLPFLADIAASAVLETVANLGIFVLVLLAGIEMEPGEIARSSKVSFAVALGGMALPLVGGFALAWVFLPETDLKLVQALIAGISLSISAIPATVKLLNELGMLHSKIGRIIVSAAAFDDVLGLFLLAILLALIETGKPPELPSLLLLAAKVLLFFVITLLLGTRVYPKISRHMKVMQAAATEFSALVIVALGYGLLAELLGGHWILGAFMAGLFFERERVGPRAYAEIRLICDTLTRGGLGPLFFLFIGLHVDLGAVTAAPVFLLLIVLVAFFGKVLGAGLPARLAGLSARGALCVGVGLSARGAVELVVLGIALEKGVFSGDGGAGEQLFSSLILMGIVTTMMAPVLLKRLLRPETHEA